MGTLEPEKLSAVCRILNTLFEITEYANDNYAEDYKNINTYENNALEVDASAFADKIVEKYLKE